jgi:cytochrome c oxidase subunit IV
MNAEATHGHEEGKRLYVMVWLGLLALTAVEVVLAYVQMFSTEGMLLILMFLSLIKAGLIVGYFMHLRFEKRTLVWSLIPAVTVVIMLLFIFFPDAVRALQLRVPQP